jgi:choline monooxygenase
MSKLSVDEFLGSECIDALRRPVETARGLPGKAYTTPEFLAIEQRDFFPKMWVAVAFTSDIPEVGDAVPLVVAGVPIILARDKDGTIKAFHNVCRHRAALVLTAPAKGLNQFACPYHAWAWTLGGDLRATPYFDGTPAAKDSPIVWEENGLMPVRVGVRHPLVFVNLDGQAPPLEETLEPFEKYVVGNFDFDVLRFGKDFIWEFEANWKTIADNWEIYHHTWVHANFFPKMSEDLDFETRQPKYKSTAEGVVLALHRQGKPVQNMQPIKGMPFIPVKGGGAPTTGTSTDYLIPNVIATVHLEHLHLVIIEPISPGRTRLRLSFFFVGDAATAPEFEAEREAVIDRRIGKSRSPKGRDGIRNQDIAIWEGQQIARGSPVADDVKFAAIWETNIHYFQNLLIDVLQRPA